MTVFVVVIEYNHGPYVAGVYTTREEAETEFAKRKAQHEAEGDWATGSIGVHEVKP